MAQTNPQPPAIEGLSHKITTLERRLAHLQRRIGDQSGRNASSVDFDKAESAALRAAIASMSFVKKLRGDT